MSSQNESGLVVGSGTLLISLVKAWYESGLSKITVLATKTLPADEENFKMVLEQTLLRTSEASLTILSTAEDNEANWEDRVRPYSFVLYAAQHGDLEELQKLQSACITERKMLLPAMGFRGMGMVGPLLQPGGDGCGETPWRRVHSSVFPLDWESQPFSDTSATLLANLVVNEWRKVVNGENEADCSNQCYILNPLTLEGSWHSVPPHRFVSEQKPILTVTDLELKLGADHEPDPEEWFSWFSTLTSAVSGIFHVWEEGALKQLPLSQCLVQPVDPISEGPAKLLPSIVSSGLTHVEARRESGLAGLESYIARLGPVLFPRLPSHQQEDIQIGAGFTFGEAVERGLNANLAKELSKRTLHRELVLTPMECSRIEDVHCRFYLQALNITEGEPLIAYGEPLLGFPVVWVHSGAAWYGSVGLDMTHTLRQSLQYALMKAEHPPVSSVIWNDHKPESVIISPESPTGHAPKIRSAFQTLKQHHKYPELFNIRCNSFLIEGPIEAVGVLLSEEATP
ncbi:hypothetical protein EBB07_22815 [Paenibacillaceae bacterium]|nr:hypothetical protein EBB07_22815 [Paenibacillaceae bacterium]